MDDEVKRILADPSSRRRVLSNLHRAFTKAPPSRAIDRIASSDNSIGLVVRDVNEYAASVVNPRIAHDHERVPVFTSDEVRYDSGRGYAVHIRGILDGGRQDEYEASPHSARVVRDLFLDYKKNAPWVYEVTFGFRITDEREARIRNIRRRGR